MITVTVVNKSSGKPAKGHKVSVYMSAFLANGFLTPSGSEYTDSEGEVHFRGESGEGEVYVDGSVKHKGRIAGRVVVYI